MTAVYGGALCVVPAFAGRTSRGARNAHAGYDALAFFPAFSIFAIRRASTFQ